MTDLSYSTTINDGDTGDVVSSKFATIVSEVRSTVNDLTNENLSGSAGIVDANLASQNNSVYRQLHRTWISITDLSTAGTYFLGDNGLAASPMSGSLALIYLDDADYTVAGKTTKLRVTGAVMCNGTAWSSVTATFGLYPVTFSGAADTLTLTLGTVVSGSTAAVANPTANGGTAPVRSTDFTIPSDGFYAMGVVLSATVTADSRSYMHTALQMRHV